MKRHKSGIGFVIDCRPDGYKGPRHRIYLDNSTEEEANAYHHELMRGNVRTTIDTPWMIKSLYNQWIIWYEANRAESTLKDAKTCFKTLLPFFGDVRPKQLSKQLCEQYKSNRLKSGIKRRTINKELTYLSSLLRWCSDNDLCEPLPFSIPLYPSSMTRAPQPRPLASDQITALYNALEDIYKLPFLLMVDAGLRRNEALKIRREHIEIKRELIIIKGKGNKERIVPITTDRLKGEIEKYKDEKGWLIKNPKTKKPYYAIRKALKRAAEKAGITKHVYHHLLRHSFGTNATVAGYDLSALQSIMGHSSPTTTMIYQNLAADYLKEQGRKLNALTGSVHMDNEKKENKDNKNNS